MPINTPTLKEINNKGRSDLEQSINIGQTDPSKKINTLRNNFIRGVVDSISGFAFDLYQGIKRGVERWLPYTNNATDETITQWSSFGGLTRNPATYSTGSVSFTGVAGTSISSGVKIADTMGNQYSTQELITIQNITLNIASVTRVGSTVTVTTLSNHLLTNNILITITGANELDYNVIDKPIIITSNTTFTFTIDTTPTSPASGTIQVSYALGSGRVVSDVVGSSSNIDFTSSLTLVSPIVNVDNDVLPTYDGIDGGADIESFADLQVRMLERFGNLTIDPTSVLGLPIYIKDQVAGVTRVFIKSAYPQSGQFTVLFLRDNDVDIIPSTAQVQDVKNAILTVKNAQMGDEDVIVEAPISVVANFNFSSLTPNTIEMQNAIRSSLEGFFKNNTEFETNITEKLYNNIIFSATDSAGNAPTDFTLTSPVGDIVAGEKEIVILGNITF